jgi:hypothetical protein
MNACRLCGATNYRRVIERSESGDMRPSGLYQCSGCSVVFADPASWRAGGSDAFDLPASPITPLRPVTVTAAEARASVPGPPSPATRAGRAPSGSPSGGS